MKFPPTERLPDARGSVGATTYSKNKAGNYVRAKVSPTNPKTTSQSNVRARLATLSQGWRNLTQTQRDSWNAAVGAYASPDVFGMNKVPTGLQLYIKLNANLLASGGTIISTPLAPTGVSTVTIGAATATAGTPTLSIPYSANVPAGTRVEIFATPVISAGKASSPAQMRLITTVAAAAASPLNAYAAWSAKFGASLVAGGKIIVGMVFVNQTSGLSSPMQRASIIIGA